MKIKMREVKPKEIMLQIIQVKILEMKSGRHSTEMPNLGKIKMHMHK